MDNELNHGLLHQPPSLVAGDTKARFWIESRKLWYIVGPSIFSRIASFSMNVVTQAFAGHLGDVELAAITISTGVIVGFKFGLLTRGAIESSPRVWLEKISRLELGLIARQALAI
ncbi:hypothetical protein Tco_1228569 [Tanacetum coccineum]